VVDTDVVSYLFKRDSRAARYRVLLRGRQPVIALMTYAEFNLWADERSWGPLTRLRLAELVESYVIHYPDRTVADHWSRIMAQGRRTGRPVGPSDAWVAATALALRAPLATHNAADFAGIPGLQVLTSPDPPAQ
jgi:predicted nucleic acid-binding protein